MTPLTLTEGAALIQLSDEVKTGKRGLPKGGFHQLPRENIRNAFVLVQLGDNEVLNFFPTQILPTGPHQFPKEGTQFSNAPTSVTVLREQLKKEEQDATKLARVIVDHKTQKRASGGMGRMLAEAFSSNPAETAAISYQKAIHQANDNPVAIAQAITQLHTALQRPSGDKAYPGQTLIQKYQTLAQAAKTPASPENGSETTSPKRPSGHS
jgi:hypothetical protein